MLVLGLDPPARHRRPQARTCRVPATNRFRAAPRGKRWRRDRSGARATAVARLPRPWRFHDRTSAMKALFGDLLPRALTHRETKPQRFDEAPAARAPGSSRAGTAAGSTRSWSTSRCGAHNGSRDDRARARTRTCRPCGSTLPAAGRYPLTVASSRSSASPAELQPAVDDDPAAVHEHSSATSSGHAPAGARHAARSAGAARSSPPAGGVGSPRRCRWAETIGPDRRHGHRRTLPGRLVVQHSSLDWRARCPRREVRMTQPHDEFLQRTSARRSPATSRCA